MNSTTGRSSNKRGVSYVHAFVLCRVQSMYLQFCVVGGKELRPVRHILAVWGLGNE